MKFYQQVYKFQQKSVSLPLQTKQEKPKIFKRVGKNLNLYCMFKIKKKELKKKVVEKISDDQMKRICGGFMPSRRTDLDHVGSYFKK